MHTGLLFILGIIGGITGIFGPRKLIFFSMLCGFFFGMLIVIFAGTLSLENTLVAFCSGIFFAFFLGVCGFFSRYYASGTTSITTYFKSYFK
jgi:hypothetical protein